MLSRKGGLEGHKHIGREETHDGCHILLVVTEDKSLQDPRLQCDFEFIKSDSVKLLGKGDKVIDHYFSHWYSGNIQLGILRFNNSGNCKEAKF